MERQNDLDTAAVNNADIVTRQSSWAHGRKETVLFDPCIFLPESTEYGDRDGSGDAFLHYW